jgi:hypothetical protein
LKGLETIDSLERLELSFGKLEDERFFDLPLSKSMEVKDLVIRSKTFPQVIWAMQTIRVKGRLAVYTDLPRD